MYDTHDMLLFMAVISIYGLEYKGSSNLISYRYSRSIVDT